MENEEKNEKSFFEMFAGSNTKGQTEDTFFMEKLANLAPWLVNIHKKDKKKVYSFHKRNSLIAALIVGILLIIAIIWDQSGSTKYQQQSTINPLNGTSNSEFPEFNLAAPSINPNAVRSNALPQ